MSNREGFGVLNGKDLLAGQRNAGTPPLLEIQLFGRFLAKIDGAAVEERRWERRSAKALVKLLSLKPAYTLHREQVIDQLWPEQSAESAVNNLNKAIHSARRALEPTLEKGSQSRFILTPRNQIILASPGVLVVDADQFEIAANNALRDRDADAARQAARMYVGALLIDDIYEEWTLARRESLRLVFRSVSIGAAELLGRRGDHAGAIEIAQRLVNDDAADEYAHQLLMRFHAETGRPHQALKQFELCRSALQALGSEIGPETRALEQAIRLGKFSLPPVEANPAVGSTTEDPSASMPHIVPLSYENGVIKAARFSPDGQTSFVNADWQGGGFDVYRLALQTGQCERIGLGAVELFSVSAAGDLAVGLKPEVWNTFNSISMLAIVAASGGDPIELLDNVQCADWQPTNHSSAIAKGPASLTRRLAIVREVGGKSRLEFPIGTVLHESAGWFSHPTFSPDGRRIAFIEHPITRDDEGDVVVLDLDSEEGRPATLARNFVSIQGLAWRRDELWFTAARKHHTRALYRVGMAGCERLVYHGLGNLKVHDCSPSGRLLISVDRSPLGTFSRRAGDSTERDISWHEFTIPRDISSDGETLLIEEWVPGGRQNYSAYIRRIDGSATRFIGEGVPLVLSPDERQVILRVPAKDSQLTLLTIETGATRLLENDRDKPLIHSEYVSWFPDGRRIAFEATDSNGGSRIYFQDLTGGKPVCFTPDESGVGMRSNHSISPDGAWIMLVNSANHVCVYRIADGRPDVLDELGSGFFPAGWMANGKDILLRRWGEIPLMVYRYNLASGTLDEWLSLNPGRHSGATLVLNLRLAPDGRSYAYGIRKESSDLYAFEID